MDGSIIITNNNSNISLSLTFQKVLDLFMNAKISESKDVFQVRKIAFVTFNGLDDQIDARGAFFICQFQLFHS
jgi:hypothetical protein